ncbi:unnamed protein product [Prorocentrum cordatum]|uniref:Distal membrane arm assembly complex 2-like protein n=1 Tax=Prorocentrum cordatum TaxID=2364126 RepID=A0ABN9RYL4_9DINO|nr:unnamed protein product [Polarella glacialis]
MLSKPSAFLVDLGLLTGDETCYFGGFGTDDFEGSLVKTCAAGRKAPLLPDAFEAMLWSKGFTNGKDDRPRVAELYREAFAQRFESAESLGYSRLCWGDEEVEQLATVLTSGAAPRLMRFYLADNRVGDEGAARLAAALGALQELRVLGLRHNRVADEGVARLAAALGALPELRELRLGGNRVGDEGVVCLAAALLAPEAPQNLQLLDLYENRVGDEGAARLAEALGALPELRELGLGGNRVGDEGAARLAAALRAPEALQHLQLLDLYGNRVGDEGAERLAEALQDPKALPGLRAVVLHHNPLGSGARAALRAAWAEAGRPEGGAFEAPGFGTCPTGLRLS